LLDKAGLPTYQETVETNTKALVKYKKGIGNLEISALPPIKHTLKLSDHGHFIIFFSAMRTYRRM